MILSKKEIERKIKRYDDRPALSNLKGKSDLIGVEIGVQYGFNSFNIINKNDIKTLYLIDPYDVYPESKNLNIDTITKEEALEIKNQAYKILSKFKDKIIWIEKYSNKAINDVPDDLDFIYIDSDHRYEIIKEEIKLYYPKVKTGGMLSGHDYKSSEQGVIRAVNEFFESNNFKFNRENQDWWLIKE